MFCAVKPGECETGIGEGSWSNMWRRKWNDDEDYCIHLTPSLSMVGQLMLHSSNVVVVCVRVMCVVFLMG